MNFAGLSQPLNMKLLIVDDNESNLSFIEEEVRKIPSVGHTVAKSRNSAFAQLAANTFDLILLDMKIPTEDGALNPNVDHGLAVHAKGRVTLLL